MKQCSVQAKDEMVSLLCKTLKIFFKLVFTAFVSQAGHFQHFKRLHVSCILGRDRCEHFRNLWK